MSPGHGLPVMARLFMGASAAAALLTIGACSAAPAAPASSAPSTAAASTSEWKSLFTTSTPTFPPPWTNPALITPTYTPPPAPAAAPATQFTTGTYEVGSGVDQIPAGKYRTSGDTWCYWARLRSTDGEVSSIIANGNAAGPTTVTIKKTDAAFKLEGTCAFTRQ